MLIYLLFGIMRFLTLHLAVVRMEGSILETVRNELIRSLLWIIIAKALQNSKTMSGYAVMVLLHQEYDFLISPGTVYATLYSLERKGVIKSILENGKRVYGLTESGKEKIKIILSAKNELLNFMKTILS
jgi:DNA-binding PadR family transcriptional regulator